MHGLCNTVAYYAKTLLYVESNPDQLLDLLIVIPVYQEAFRIESTVKEIIEFFKNKQLSYQIVLSVDPSPDGSELVCKDLSETYKDVTLIIGNKKAGRGIAVRRAWETYEAKVYSFIDADLSVGLDALFEGFSLIRDDFAKFVIGSRYSAGSVTIRPPLRKVVSFSYNVILQKLFKNEIKDYQCGLKIMSKDIMNPIVDLSRVNSWFWDAEIIIIALHLHISVFQLPVRWYEVKYSRTSLKRLFHDIILHGWGILLLFKRLRNYSV